MPKFYLLCYVALLKILSIRLYFKFALYEYYLKQKLSLHVKMHFAEKINLLQQNCQLPDCSIRVTDYPIRVYQSFFCDLQFNKQEYTALLMSSFHYASIMLNAFRHLSKGNSVEIIQV